MKIFKIAAFLSLLGTLPCEAQTTRSGMLGYNTSTFTNCGTNCITGTQLQIWNSTLVNSAGFLQDSNNWTGRNVFNNTLQGAINLAPAAPPSTPANGDLWTTGAGIFVQIGGISYNLLGGGGDTVMPAGTIKGNNTGSAAAPLDLTAAQVAAMLPTMPANVSGSGASTTGSLSSGSTTLTLASALDFANGQGIAVEHAGVTFSGATPTGVSVAASGDSGQGPVGSTSYVYAVSCVDDNGGVGAAVMTAAISNGYATLGHVTQSGTPAVAYNHVFFTTTCPAVAVWRNAAGGGYHLIAVTPNGEFYDAGAPQIVVPWVPDTPPGSALNDRLVTTITSGAGTASLTLAASASNSASGVYTRHDDTTALLAYLNSTTTPALLAGTYNIEATAIPASVVSLSGAGTTATIIKGWNAAAATLSANSGSSLNSISRMSVVSGSTGGTALSLRALTGCSVTELALSGNIPLYSNGLTGCSITNNNLSVWYSLGYEGINGTGNLISNNTLGIGIQSPRPGNEGFYFNGGNGERVENNRLNGGTYFGIQFTNSGSGIISGNMILNSQREALHLSGSCSANLLTNNYINGGYSSIDFGISISDDGLPSVSMLVNKIANNLILNSGTSGIGVLNFGGSSPNINGTVVSDNTIGQSNRVATTNPEIFLAGSGVVATVLYGNVFQSGPTTVNYGIQEANFGGYGLPSYTQVGANYGFAGGSGLAGLIGTGSVKLTGGATGL